MPSVILMIGALATVIAGSLGPIAPLRRPGRSPCPVPTRDPLARFHWHVTDTRSSPGAYCTYDGGDPRRRVFVPVHMPRIYWPDTHPGRTDSGTVGWQIELQVAPTPAGRWRVAYVSSITTAIASEVRAARVPKHAINWRVLRGHAWYRVVDRVIWYGPHGTRLATRTHLVTWYQLARALSPWHEGSPGGWNIGRTLGLRHHDCAALL